MAPPFASACMKRSGSGDPMDAGGDLVRFEDALPVVAHEYRLAELDRLVAGVGERAVTLAEDHGSQNVDVAEQEVERGLPVDAAGDDLVDALPHDLEQRGAH